MHKLVGFVCDSTFGNLSADKKADLELHDGSSIHSRARFWGLYSIMQGTVYLWRKQLNSDWMTKLDSVVGSRSPPPHRPTLRYIYYPLQTAGFPSASVFLSPQLDHAIAQAVSRRLPTATVRVRAWFRSCGICGGQNDNGAGFLRVLRFPLPFRIQLLAPQSSSVVWGWYSRPNSGRSTKRSESHPKKKYLYLFLLLGICSSVFFYSLIFFISCLHYLSLPLFLLLFFIHSSSSSSYSPILPYLLFLLHIFHFLFFFLFCFVI
jgi:hypothetical protein